MSYRELPGWRILDPHREEAGRVTQDRHQLIQLLALEIKPANLRNRHRLLALRVNFLRSHILVEARLHQQLVNVDSQALDIEYLEVETFHDLRHLNVVLCQLDDHVDLLRLEKLDHHLPAAELAVGLRRH